MMIIPNPWMLLLQTKSPSIALTDTPPPLSYCIVEPFRHAVIILCLDFDKRIISSQSTDPVGAVVVDQGSYR